MAKRVQELIGKVVSNKCDKTITVLVKLTNVILYTINVLSILKSMLHMM